MDPPTFTCSIGIGRNAADEFHQTLKTGDLSDMMVVRPEFDFSSSSLLDKAFCKDNKWHLIEDVYYL